jgi:hypothetical protein
VSITVEYSFNSDLALPQLAVEISRRLGCVLEPDPGDPEVLFTGSLFGMKLTLWAHTLDNDGDLIFEDYRYRIGNKTWADSPLLAIQVEVIALIAYFLHDTPLNIHRGMLSYDMQTLLARYEERGDGWCDLVSGKRVIYPEHLVDINTRIHDPAGRGWSRQPA